MDLIVTKLLNIYNLLIIEINWEIQI